LHYQTSFSLRQHSNPAAPLIVKINNNDGALPIITSTIYARYQQQYNPIHGKMRTIIHVDIISKRKFKIFHIIVSLMNLVNNQAHLLESGG